MNERNYLIPEAEYSLFYLQKIPLKLMLCCFFSVYTFLCAQIFPNVSLLKSKIVAIFVVTLPSPLPAGSCCCRHAGCHMPSTRAKDRPSLRHPATSFRCLVCCLGDSVPTNLNPICVFLIVPHCLQPPLRHSSRADLK